MSKKTILRGNLNTVVLIGIFKECIAEYYTNEQFYECVMSPELEKLSKSLENVTTVAHSMPSIPHLRFGLGIRNCTCLLSDQCFHGSLWLIECIMQDMEQCTGWKCLVWKTRIQVKCN